jgi:hypothetical protein
MRRISCSWFLTVYGLGPGGLLGRSMMQEARLANDKRLEKNSALAGVRFAHFASVWHKHQ